MTMTLYLLGFTFFLIISDRLVKVLQRSNGIFTILFYLVVLGGLLGYLFTDYLFLRYLYYFISFPALALVVLKWLLGAVLILVGYGKKK